VALAAAFVAVVAASTGRSQPASGSLARARTLVAKAHIVDGVAPSKAAGTCGQNGLVCLQVSVPLDRTGVVPGTISLHVEELPAAGTPRGVMFLIAGGPGQGSAHTFGLGTPSADSLFRFLFPGYTLVAYDDRGTGSSGLIDCPALQIANTEDTEKAAAAACGSSLGPNAGFYSTADHAEDLDAVRQALGVDKVALYGVSYGTKLATAYALAHPDHVERLLLDSVLPTDLNDSYGSNVLRSLPSTLATLCAGGCNGPQLSADMVALANKYAAAPLVGKVGSKTVKVDGLEMLSVVLDADLNPGLAAELPGTLHAARLGNTQPLLRLASLHDAGSLESSADLSFGLYAATVCRDGPFPWTPDTPIGQRPAILQAAVQALPPGTLGAFGSWAVDFGNADFCTGWPSPAGGATLGAGPLPNVPMLAVSGGFDMRTPTAGAASVVAKFPQGHLTVVPGVGHSTVTADPSGCAANAVRTWMLGGVPPATCTLQPPLVRPVTTLPPAGTAKPKRAATPRATLAVARATIQEAQAVWLMTSGLVGDTERVPGVFGGTLVGSGRSFKLVNYADSRGFTLSGTLTLSKTGPPVVFQGALTVGGAAAAHGILGVAGTTVRGSLGGTSVG
jgi:pimeloyl-ACP methyl ester carboxylesterase